MGARLFYARWLSHGPGATGFSTAVASGSARVATTDRRSSERRVEVPANDVLVGIEGELRERLPRVEPIGELIEEERRLRNQVRVVVRDRWNSEPDAARPYAGSLVTNRSGMNRTA